MTARRFALALARKSWVGGGISFLLRHVSRLLPIKRVYEDGAVVAFLHPAPSYDPHVLIVPKVRAKTPFDLSDAQAGEAVRAALAVARGYDAPLELRINGGARQDVMQAHFHLYPAHKTPAGRRVGAFSEALCGVRGARGFSLVWRIDDSGAAGIWIEG